MESDSYDSFTTLAIWINSDIYINQVFKELRLPFYEKYAQDSDYMIWIDNRTGYHTSKAMAKWRYENKLKGMDWLTQSPDLNPIENL